MNFLLWFFSMHLIADTAELDSIALVLVLIVCAMHRSEAMADRNLKGRQVCVQVEYVSHVVFIVAPSIVRFNLGIIEG